jgi:internalin A
MTHDELLQLIDQAAAEGWPELDLAGKGLTTLPPEIGKLTQLEVLILGKYDDESKEYVGNRLTALPKELSHLANLKSIDLSDNEFSQFPDEILQLRALTELDISKNQLATIPASLGQLKHLTSLGLQRNNLVELPLVVTQLTALEFLGLGGNQIEELPPEIIHLINLKILYLWENQITTIPDSLAQLAALQQLSLGENQITTIPDSLAQLAALQQLDLSDNQITTIPDSLAQLAALQQLNLYLNQITTIPDSLAQLAALQQLSLGENQITTIPDSLAQLAALQQLSLGGNQITTIPDSLAQLAALQQLSLGGNQITTIPDSLGQLAALQWLDLSVNQITTIPDSLAQLAALQQLSLWGNQITTIPDSLAQLAALQQLDLRHNQITTIPDSLAQLAALQQLDLYNNQITTIPDSLAQLAALQQLDLGWNQITTIPDSLGQLAALQQLNLGQNQITTIPDSLAQLAALQLLDLGSNQITTIPDSLAQLAALQQLNLGSNQITTIPDSLAQMPKLEKLDLRGNPISVPPELLGPKELHKDPGDVRDILDYYFQTLDPNDTDPLYEAKFIIVGEGGAGKTTLAKKLLDPGYELDSAEQSTEGIDVLRWEFEQADGTPFRINIWDFGGQEIYHATHQFFLTKRSLYALVVDTRQNNTDLYYWLKVIELLSDSSPVVIIKNEKQDRQCQVNERQLRGEFTNLEKVLAMNPATPRGLEEIAKLIQQRIVQLPHVGTPLPKVWVRVRAALENYVATRNYISVDEYYAICRTCQLTDQQRMLSLSSYLHDLGVILHFQADPVLKHTVILKPEWGTAAVYKALDTDEVRGNCGRFTRRQLDAIWSDGDYASMRDELLHLMMRFKLCYLIPGTQDRYIAPQLLEIDKPSYPWDDSQNLLLRYDYDFMPKGIVTRLIVELHEFIEAQVLVWKSGVVLTNGSARAEVIEYQHKGEIHLRVSGVRQKDLLTVVSHEIDKINASYERLRVKKQIPCHCAECEGSDAPQFFPMDVLNRFIDNGQSKIQCQTSFDMVDVRQLILGVSDLMYAAPAQTAFRVPAGDNDYLMHPETRMKTWPVQTLNLDDDPLQQRMALFETLSRLPPPQFEKLVFGLKVPRENLGGAAAAQGDRVPKLLEWAESDMGCGLTRLQQVLDQVMATGR